MYTILFDFYKEPISSVFETFLSSSNQLCITMYFYTVSLSIEN